LLLQVPWLSDEDVEERELRGLLRQWNTFSCKLLLLLLLLLQVPWLSDEDVEERELRGLVAVSLLGTLEEVGWQLREKLLALWAGERDLDALTAEVGAREAAALTAILYHTEQLEREFGGPPAAGVAAAVKAGRGVPADASDAAAAAAMAAVADVAGKDGGGKQ
jgi:hypothetical protein